MTIVQLSWREVRLAAFAGVDRRLYALHKGLTDRNGAPAVDAGWQLDIVGTLGEWTVAKALGLYWCDHEPRLAPAGDVARLQVRATTRRDGSLIVHPDDPDGAAFVLVVGHPPTLDVAGWMAGSDAKQERWWRADVRTPAFFVPRSSLRPLSELEVEP